MSFRNPVGGPRIVPFGQARLKSDVLKNGHPGFRVTQSFNHFDVIFRNRIHGAMDIGNFWCGDSVLAMDSGTLTRMRDPNGALGVSILHPNGMRTEYWHLKRYAKFPSNGWIRKGSRIGYVGSSGLDIGGCHLHVVVRNAAGTAIDPWPYMNP